MPKFDATINGISLASYGVEPNMATVPQPDAKRYQAATGCWTIRTLTALCDMKTAR